ncbi:MAG: hypothetical protein HOQ11_02465 [Gemmatimonadaceae bacterium]|nr:hypothetical protein [Gemmatimonadaceae bacterium]NUQ93052.1 hypothetical protein [Gemmatimonadaceae bacterium]NUR18444.1 hypothetical protein [Gemmatimonadaceae bacterium]NUS96251.1 hypothetical protein [Gemmatimonadaceae bacterium]
MTLARALAVTAACALTGCGTILHGPRQAVPVNSNPAGATVQTTPAAEGGTVTTPGTLDLERKHSYQLTFTSPGYSPATVNLHPNIGTGTVIADVLLTGLVGVIVDGATGSWYGLVPENVTATLNRTTGTGPERIEVHVGRSRDGQKVEVTTDGPAVQVEVKKE